MPEAATVEPTAGHRAALQWIANGPRRMLIGGKQVDAASGRTFATENPETEAVLVEVAEADSQDVDLAVKAARAAFESPKWSGMSPHARTQVLLKIADIIERNSEELAVLETLDNGAPIAITRRFVAYAAQTFRYYAGWPTKIMGSTMPSDPSKLVYVLREPVGVCGLINAWNAPIGQAATKIAPALACGNTVLVKPAEQTPLTTLRLGELIQECDLPPGVVNILPGFGNKAGAAIVAHDGVDKVAFTGSTVVGKQILAASAGNLKKLTLELGGKSPNIVFADADLDAAITASVNAFTRNSGQICSAGTRLFVHESLHDEVVERVAKRAGGYKVGSPFATDTELGPLISAKQMQRVLSYVESGRGQGAKLSLGGSRVGKVGYFVEPTVFSNVGNAMKIAQEEIFGPVLSVIPFKDENDAIFQGNDTQYGLAAAVWTRDISRAHKVARALKAGRVWINTYGEIGQVFSTGGYKQSGIGREMGPESIDAYTQTKPVIVKL